MDQKGNNTATQTGWQTVSNTTFTQDINNTSSKIRDTNEFQDCMKRQTNMCIQSTGMQIAQRAKDSSFCKELPSSEEQLSCEFAITMMSAQEKGDDKLCDTLKNANYLKQCKIQVYRQAAVSKNDISFCDKIDTVIKSTDATVTSETSTLKDQCIIQFIASSADSKESDCKKLSSTSSLDMCKMILKNKQQFPNNTLPPVMPTIPNR